MKISLILLTSLFIAFQAPGQNNRDFSFSCKPQYNFNEAGKNSGFLYSVPQKSPGKNKPASVTAIKQKLESALMESWDAASGQWISYSKSKFTYDENLNCILFLTSEWDRIDNYWLDYHKIEFGYDAQGNVISEVNSFWDYYNKLWRSFDKWEYKYDAGGNRIWAYSSRLNENTGQWEMHHKEEYAYDIKGNRISLTGTSWDEDTNQWVQGEKEEYSYNANEKITYNNIFYWDELSGLWVNNHKEEHVYDIEGNNILIRQYYLRWSDSVWVETIKEENTFDKDHNWIVNIQHEWDDSTKIEFMFNNSYPFEELVLPYLYTEEYCRHMLTMILYYTPSDSGWILENRANFIYAEVNTSNLSETEDNNISAYPNPASQFVSFDADKPLVKARLVVFDMQGREVMTQVVGNNMPVSIKQLDKGLYLYQLSDDGGIYKGKIVIE